MNVIRGFVAVIAGVAVMSDSIQMLDGTLLNALARQPGDAAAVLGSPLMMMARLTYTAGSRGADS